MLANSPPASSQQTTASGMTGGPQPTTPATETSMGPVYDETRESAAHAGDNDDHHDDHPDDDHDDGAYNEWDEGGPSQCGYRESVHYTLMSVGKSVHGVVGDPSPGVERGMRTIGNWFQEASYAVRDFWRGNKQELGDDASETFVSMKDDALAAVNDIMGKNNNNDASKIDAQAMNDAIVNGPSTPYTAQTN